MALVDLIAAGFWYLAPAVEIVNSRGSSDNAIHYSRCFVI
jgi:hypothetical protein